jgi:hypothetical protein
MGTKYVTNSSRTARRSRSDGRPSDLAAYNSQGRRNKDSMGDNKKETGRLIKYLKETGLLYTVQQRTQRMKNKED